MHRISIKQSGGCCVTTSVASVFRLGGSSSRHLLASPFLVWRCATIYKGDTDDEGPKNIYKMGCRRSESLAGGSIQHSKDADIPVDDGYPTDDIIKIIGFRILPRFQK